MKQPIFNKAKVKFDDLVKSKVYDITKSLQENANNLIASCTAIDYIAISNYVQRELMPKPNFLLEDIMLTKGFVSVAVTNDSSDVYLKYENNATIHYNTDYNKEFPEPKGKVIIYVNFGYGEFPFVSIYQDGGTRCVYHGIIQTEEFFDQILYSIR